MRRAAMKGVESFCMKTMKSAADANQRLQSFEHGGAKPDIPMI
jgi:hypothetical protein